MARVEGSAQVTVGVEQAFYAVMLTDPWNTDPKAQDAETPTYSTPVPLKALREVAVSGGDSNDTHYGDNIPLLNAKSKGGKTVNVTRFDFMDEELQLLLGWERTAEGELFESGNSIPPDVAFGYIRKLSDGRLRYGWLFKGSFALNQDNAQTQEATISPQFQQVVGSFIARQCDRAIQRRMTEGGENFDPVLAANWFTVETLQKLMVSGESDDTGDPENFLEESGFLLPESVLKAQAEAEKAATEAENAKRAAVAAKAAAEAAEISAKANAAAEAAKLKAAKLAAEAKAAASGSGANPPPAEAKAEK